MPGARHGLGPVGDVQLAIDTGCVSLDSAGGYKELPGDFLVGAAQGDEVENFQLTLAQGFRSITCWGGSLWRCCAFMRFSIELGEQMAGIVPQGAGAGMGQPLSEQPLHGLIFVQKDPYVSLRLGQGEGALQVCLCCSCITLPRQCQAAEDAQFEHCAHPSAILCGSEGARQLHNGFVRIALRKSEPGRGKGHRFCGLPSILTHQTDGLLDALCSLAQRFLLDPVPWP